MGDRERAAVAGMVVVCALVWASGAWAASSSFTAVFSPQPNLTVLRNLAAAAPLPGGDVLIAGGTSGNGGVSSAEVYDSSADTFTALSGQMTTPRQGEVAAPLPGGDVLIAGGQGSTAQPLASAELYDPATQTFTALSSHMTTSRTGAVAAPLPGGDVLIAGGVNSGGFLSSAEVYDPSTQTFSATTGQMTVPRAFAGAAALPNGDVLIAGGEDSSGNGNGLSSAEVYDPSTQTFSATQGQMTTPRFGAVAAALPVSASLPDGGALIAGGSSSAQNGPMASAEVYDASTQTFTALASQMTEARGVAVAAPLSNGEVLIAGGSRDTSAEVYDPSHQTFTALVFAARIGAVAAPLPGGDVLIAGGTDLQSEGVSSSADLYDPSTQKWAHLSSHMTEVRVGAVAARLPGGDVLIAGGTDLQSAAVSSSAELYDPATQKFTALNSHMTTARVGAVAAPLPGGDVLIAGGADSNFANYPLSTAELYDPATQKFTALNSHMTTARLLAVAAPLPGGDVLIAGGTDGTSQGQSLASAELYDPATHRFTALSSQMTAARSGAVAAPLANGDVLIAGGRDPNSILASAELYDPVTRTFTALATQMSTGRWWGAAAQLADGGVLIYGGDDSSSNPSSSGDVFESAQATVSGAKFGRRAVGSRSPAQTLKVTDRGALPLRITGATLRGNRRDFAIAGDGCAGKHLAVGQTCTIRVTFTPTAAGRRTATLTLIDNEPVPASAALSGTAISPPNTAITGANIRSARREATFDFKGSGGVGALHFQCMLDSEGWKSCTSPKTYTGLTHGSNTFQVRAIDSRGSTDPTPAKLTITI